jgi:broad specificity phosphatase PhoE
MSVTTLYLVRHGETAYNRQRIMQGRRINSHLNETGRWQAQALRHRLARIPLDALYSSTLYRAQETAAIIAQAHPGLSVHALGDLEEMSWGVLEGQAIEPHVKVTFGQMVQAWSAGQFDVRAEEGESILEVQQRAVRAIDHILAHHAGQTVLVVTHGRLLRVLLATLLPEYGLHRMEELQHANTAVNRLYHRHGRFEADLLNCTAHLEAVESILVE